MFIEGKTEEQLADFHRLLNDVAARIEDQLDSIDEGGAPVRMTIEDELAELFGDRLADIRAGGDL